MRLSQNAARPNGSLGIIWANFSTIVVDTGRKSVQYRTMINDTHTSYSLEIVSKGELAILDLIADDDADAMRAAESLAETPAAAWARIWADDARLVAEYVEGRIHLI